MSLLEVNDLRVRFHGTAPDHYAVDGVSFSMEQGDILGLVGESGTGKTVTAMCISGLLPREKAYRSGNILLDNTEIFDCTEEELNRMLGSEMTVVFQEPMTSFNPVYRIGRQVEEGLYVHEKHLNRRKHVHWRPCEEQGLWMRRMSIANIRMNCREACFRGQ